MEEFFQAYSGEKNGAIQITSQKPMAIEAQSGHSNLWQVRGKFWDDNSATIQYGLLSLDNFVLSPESSGIYQSESMLNNPGIGPLFGKTVMFQVDRGDIDRTVVLQSGLYVPADLTLTSPVKTTSGQVLPKNTVLAWNADTNNTKGIYVLIEFDPEDQDNAAFNDGIRHYQYNVIQADDDGSYALSNADFDGMPAGAKIMLWVGRGNYALIDGADGINQYALYSYILAVDNFILGQ